MERCYDVTDRWDDYWIALPLDVIVTGASTVLGWCDAYVGDHRTGHASFAGATIAFAQDHRHLRLWVRAETTGPQLDDLIARITDALRMRSEVLEWEVAELVDGDEAAIRWPRAPASGWAGLGGPASSDPSSTGASTLRVGRSVEPGAIRPLGPADLRAFCALSEARGWGPSRAKWELALGFGHAWGIDDGAGGLFGTVTLMPTTDGSAVLGGLLVAAGHERQGLGAALVDTACAAAAAAPVVLYATPAGRQLYERLGFVPDGEVAVLRNGWARERAVGVVVGVADPATVATLAELDREALGGDRRPLIEALATRPGSVVALHRSGRAGGVAWSVDGTMFLGPIAAALDHEAAAVIRSLLATAGHPNRVDVPVGQERLLLLCAELGFVEERRAPRMVRPGTAGAIVGPFDPRYRSLAAQGLG